MRALTSTALALLLVSADALAQTPTVPTYWGSLTPGAHPVGFRQAWVIDSTRRVPAGPVVSPRFRAILLNLWYPATASASRTPRMPYKDYFDGPERVASAAVSRARAGMPSTLIPYARAVAEHSRRIATEEMAGGERGEIEESLRQRLDQFLESATAARRDAPMLPGRLPVVVYVQGSGSSFDDNVALCEYLASRGYLVLGAAFQSEGNETLSTNATDESRQRDIRRLYLELMRLPEVELGPVVAIGHSAGAQAMLLFATDPSAPIDAVLALDTTQDYALLTDRSWYYFTDRVIEMRRSVRRPIAFFADPGALYELGDSLKFTRRWYVSTPELGHNDFISQGNIGRSLRAVAGDSAETQRIRHVYDAVTRYTAAWVDAFVADSSLSGGPLPPEPMTLEFSAAGTAAPVVGGQAAASARGLRHLFFTADISAFADAVVDLRRVESPAATNRVLAMLFAGAINGTQRDRAVAAYANLKQRDSTVVGVAEILSARRDMFAIRLRAPHLARPWELALQTLEPEARLTPP